MSIDSTAHRLLPHLRRVAIARGADMGDGQLLASFVASRDGDAFAALVRRHGPMVLGVCRRVIGDAHLAEDAFQATFLVLARRAAVVRPRHLVGHWLYGVAYRTALKARGAAARHYAKEKQVDAMPHPAVSPDEAWADLQPVLDAELARLPDKYRIPIVLCDLTGRPQRDVARELKLPAATLASRLAAARRLLAKRLTNRGVVLSAGAVSAALGWHAAISAVPPALANATVQAACAAAAGTAIGLPAPVVELSEGVMRMFVFKKLKALAGVATCVVLVAGLGLMCGPSLRANPDEKPATPPKSEPPAAAQLPGDSEDAKFLRRTSLDMRGTLPTVIELRYFVADTDTKKRQKVVEWMWSDHGKQKVSTMCASCHKGIEGSDWLGANERSGAGVHGWFARHSDHTARYYADFIAGLYLQTDDRPELAEAKAAVELSRANVGVAEATLKVAEAQTARNKDALKENLAKIDVAKAELARANAQLKAAEARLAQEESARTLSNYYRLKLKSQSEKPPTALDRLVESHWKQLASQKEPGDLEFLRRVSMDVRGVPPTKVEENYFVADKDPKKRERLLEMMASRGKAETVRERFIDELLKDPGVQARWVELWKDRIEKERQRSALEAWVKKPGDRLGVLLGQLLDGNKTDEQILEALSLATMARFPTATERKLILEGLKTQPDRREAWNGVLSAMAATDEAKAHATGLAKRGGG